MSVLGEGATLTGLGMNEGELKANAALSSYNIVDLNKSARLPYPDSSFDMAFCQLSIDYLTSPISVLKEVSRVLAPGGLFAVSFSDRVFMSKQVAVWSGRDDFDHLLTVAGYFGQSKRGEHTNEA